MDRRDFLRLSAVAVGTAVTASAVGAAAPARAAQIDNDLRAKAKGDPSALHPVVVTYRQSGPLSSPQIAALESLGITTGITMRSLPIAGLLVTAAQLDELEKNPDVVSVVENTPLTYYNYESREISGVKRAVDNPGAFRRAVPFSGAGVTVVVNDSGIDATHADLKYGRHVVENVFGTQNLIPEVGNELLGAGILPITYVEGVLNTDIGSGHGTHCAGSVGATGERSGRLYQGVAPGADIVGYGSGAVLLILDAVGGLDYAATNQFRFDSPIRVTSNSWGSSGPFDPMNPVNVATYELYKRGIVSAFAAGNDGPGEDAHNTYSQAPWVISVGAGTKSGQLADFSSRGKRGEKGTFTMPDGQTWTYVNEPDIVATGVDVISTRDTSGGLHALSTEQDIAAIAPAHLPFYSHMSGTSMATPHLAGIVALVLEANPDLTPEQVRSVLRRTATNMTGRGAWEVGAGHVNAYAALAVATKIRGGFGKTVNAWRKFNANAVLVPGKTSDFAFDFSPVGPTGEQSFEVAVGAAWVTARAVISENTLALVLVDPDGERYGSSVALPLLGDTVSTSAPAKPGTWKVTARGIGSLSGVALDPASVTNGYGVPGRVEGQISTLNSGGYTGLNDISAHPARGAIENAVAKRLVDSDPGGAFRPNDPLKRDALANFLVMGENVRQHLPFDGRSPFSDVAATSVLYPFAAAAASKGGALRDRSNAQEPVLPSIKGAFQPAANVTRASLAYALVQSLALQEEARAMKGPLTAFYDGKRIPVEDAASLGSIQVGYAQIALDQGLLNARFTLTQGEFDDQPTIKAHFDGGRAVSRAAFAVSTSRFNELFTPAA